MNVSLWLRTLPHPTLVTRQVALQLKRRKQRLLRKGATAQAAAVPDVLILRYDDLLRRPIEVVKEVRHKANSVKTPPRRNPEFPAHMGCKKRTPAVEMVR